MCGAALITPTRALTVATCFWSVPPYPINRHTIKAGSIHHFDYNEPNDSTAQYRTLSEAIIHPKWHFSRPQNDIVILKWVTPLVLNAVVRPIALPAPNHVVPYGKSGVASGWGSTKNGDLMSRAERLRAVSLPFVTEQQCNRAYNGTVSDMLCAGFPQGGRGICWGDKGGPLVDRVLNTPTLAGLGSWTYMRGCALPGKPSVFTYVPYFLPWIRANL